jgi:hypothetical protein
VVLDATQDGEVILIEMEDVHRRVATPVAVEHARLKGCYEGRTSFFSTI